MLVKVSVDNFKSFQQPTEMTMISSSKIRTNGDHRRKIKSTLLLKYSVVYGANASGKSNLIEFFRFFKECVQHGIPMEAAQMFCKNQKENEQKPSSFEIQFTVDGVFYAYGFSAVLSRRQITEEWLYELYQNGTSKLLFERTGTAAPMIGEDLNLTSIEKNKFSIYAEDFAGHETSLFLTEMNRNKKYEEDSKLKFFRIVYDWVNTNVAVMVPSAPITNFEYYYDQQSLETVNQLINIFDTGISNVKIEETDLEELSNLIPKSVYNQLMSQIKRRMSEQSKTSFRMSMRTEKNFFNISVEDGKEPVITTIKLKHGKSFFDFNFEDESDGTRRLFDLLDMLLTNSKNTVFVVDELERSLHPKLTEHFLKLFMEFHKEDEVQLIFTTHEAAIMDQSIFRRDEIWFVERDTMNNSTIYSLDRFKERYDKVLSKAYLEGRYGAIPVFSSFNFKK